MCECISKTEQQLKEKIEASSPSAIKPKKATSLRHVTASGGMDFVNGKFVLSVPFFMSWNMADGSIKQTQIPIHPPYCPFCGEKFESKKDETSSVPA